MANERIVIVDTCILDYGTKKHLSGEVYGLLRSLEKEGYKLTVSAYQLFEAYRGMKKDKVPIMKELLKPFTALDVQVATFKIAAALYTCYKSVEATKSIKSDRPRNDDDGDVVIAATAFHYNTLVLTANGNDFPRPFFSEVGKPYILERADNKAQIRVHILQAEIAVFNDTVKNCL